MVVGGMDFGKIIGGVAGKGGGSGAGGIIEGLSGIIGQGTKSKKTRDKEKKSGKSKPAATQIAESVGKIVKQKDAERRKKLAAAKKGTKLNIGRSRKKGKPSPRQGFAP